MDAARFESLLRAITASRSRREAVRLLAASVAASVGLTQVRYAAAQTCLANGERCDPNADPNGCCSGKCSRRRKKCRPAPDQGTCTVEQDLCTGPNVQCGESEFCYCYVTLRGASFCGGPSIGCGPSCTSDEQCAKRSGNKRARCVDVGTECCTDYGPGGCVLPCSDPA